MKLRNRILRACPKPDASMSDDEWVEKCIVSTLRVAVNEAEAGLDAPRGLGRTFLDIQSNG